MRKILMTLLLLSGYVNALSQTDSFNDVVRHVAFNNYSFIAPEKWRIHEEKDFITLTQSQTGEPGCLIIIFSPQPSSGDLETDAQNVFTQGDGSYSMEGNHLTFRKRENKNPERAQFLKTMAFN